jgi:hypothetical protein
MDAPVLHRLKPAAPATAHLLLAALLWSVVGTVLALFGGRWIWLDWGWAGAAASAAALTVGIAKSHWVLDRAAGRMAGRIAERGDGHCIGGFLSWKTWLLVALMSGGGRLLRYLVGANGFVGLLYLAVGVALVRSSRILWRERAALRRAG